MRLLPIVLLLAGLAGCSKREAPAAEQASVTAEPFGAAECAACGMIVREQTSPRAQLVHRDGTRAHFCSVGDMLTYLDTPSPHGRAAHVFVELSAPKDPLRFDPAPTPWVSAEAGHYVVGVERPRVMGPPVLSFGKLDQAREAAGRLGGRAVDWSGLKAAAKAPR